MSPAPSALDKDWTAHRSKILAQLKAAEDEGQAVVWVAERNACPNCLAYQGHVVAPSQPFPAGLTYGDHALKPYGELIGPPLHPHCRCELELTDLEPGSLDLPLAREAARSVARGLTDHASAPAKLRATKRLLARKDKAGLLPKSVQERAGRNAAAGAYKARPGSPAAKLEIVQRQASRKRTAARRTPAPAPVRAVKPKRDAELERISRAKDVSTQEILGGQSGRTFLVQTKDGRRAIHKVARADQDADDVAFLFDGEELASTLADAIGADIARVYRDGPGSVWVEYVDGPHPELGQRYPGDELIGLLDVLTGYRDRRSGLRVQPDGSLKGFDSGGSWLEAELGRTDRAPSESGAPSELWDGPPLIDAKELRKIRARIALLAPQFAKAGRSDWLQYSLGVLDGITGKV